MEETEWGGFEQCGAADQYFRLSDVATPKNSLAHFRHYYISQMLLYNAWSSAPLFICVQQRLRPARCNEESRPEKYTAFGTDPLPSMPRSVTKHRSKNGNTTGGSCYDCFAGDHPTVKPYGGDTHNGDTSKNKLLEGPIGITLMTPIEIRSAYSFPDMALSSGIPICPGILLCRPASLTLPLRNLKVGIQTGLRR
jgi:hypothetical protein